MIYQEVDKVEGRNFAVIVDEAHSSQTGSSAIKLKTALADTEAALREYAEIEGKAEDEIDRTDKIVEQMISHGKHKNLSCFAFTATPKAQTLEMFGEPFPDGTFHPFHIYSMRQATLTTLNAGIVTSTSSLIGFPSLPRTGKSVSGSSFACSFLIL